MAACAASDEAADDSGAAFTNETKTFLADVKKVKTEDAIRFAGNEAIKALNNTLGGFIGWEAPTVYNADGVRSSVIPASSQIKSISTIRQGLAADFGERELPTQVQDVRLAQLAKGATKYYVQSGAKTGLGAAWSVNTGGIGGTDFSIGFQGDQHITQVVVAADDDNVGDLVGALGKATLAQRNFIHPTTVDDLRSMKPGEMVAWRGAKQLAGNFGASTPLFTTDPAGLTLKIVFSAAVSYLIDGEFVDTQIVRLGGDEVVIDLGVENAKSVKVQAQIQDRWGVKSLCDDGVPCLRSQDGIDLKRLAEKTVASQLNKLSLIDIHGGGSSGSSHVTLQRFRVHLDKIKDDDTGAALFAAMAGDIRNAQAISTRDGVNGSAIVNDFDVLRASQTTSVNFGFGIFGMNIFKYESGSQRGVFQIQTPTGGTSIAFDRKHKGGGWFSGDHDMTRTGLAALSYDAATPEVLKSEANLLVQTVTGNAHLTDDKVMDNIDATLLGIGASKIVDKLDEIGNQMTSFIWKTCPVLQSNDNNDRDSFDEACNVTQLDSPTIKGLQQRAATELAPLVSALPKEFQSLAQNLANARLALHAAPATNYMPQNGPNASFTLDARFDEAALNKITSKSKDEYAAALRAYVTATAGNRVNASPEIDTAKIASKIDDGDVEKMANAFASRASAYKRQIEIEQSIAKVSSGKGYSPFAAQAWMDPKVTDDNKKYETATLDSPTRQRALQAAGLFDDLKKAGDGLDDDLYVENRVTYPLLALLPPENIAVTAVILVDGGSLRFQKAGFKAVKETAQGSKVATISTDIFDLDAVINAR